MPAQLKHSKRETSYQQRGILKRVGTKIRDERNRLGLSLEALARRVGISKMTLHRTEKGSTSPSMINFTRISLVLTQFVGWGDSEKSNTVKGVLQWLSFC